GLQAGDAHVTGVLELELVVDRRRLVAVGARLDREVPAEQVLRPVLAGIGRVGAELWLRLLQADGYRLGLSPGEAVPDLDPDRLGLVAADRDPGLVGGGLGAGLGVSLVSDRLARGPELRGDPQPHPRPP